MSIPKSGGVDFNYYNRYVHSSDSYLGNSFCAIFFSLSLDLELLAEDSYDGGWLILVEPSNLDDDLAKLIHGDDVKPWLEEEVA